MDSFGKLVLKCVGIVLLTIAVLFTLGKHRPAAAAETSRITWDCQKVGGENRLCLISEDNLKTLLSQNKKLQDRFDEIDESNICKNSKT